MSAASGAHAPNLFTNTARFFANAASGVGKKAQQAGQYTWENTSSAYKQSATVVNAFSTSIDNLDKTAKFVLALNKILSVVGASFNALQNLAKPLGGVVFVDDALNPFLTIWPILNGDFMKESATAKAWRINLICVQLIAWVKVADVVGLIDTAKFASLIGHVPLIGNFLGSVGIGGFIQPFVICLSVFSILKNVEKLKTGKLAQDQALTEQKKQAWTEITYDLLDAQILKAQEKNNDKLTAEQSKAKPNAERVKNLLAKQSQLSSMIRNHLVDGVEGEPNTIERTVVADESTRMNLMTKKIAKYTDLAHNNPLERRKTYVGIAVDIVKIIAAIATLVGIVCAVAGCPVGALAVISIVCASIALTSASCQLTKVGYNLWISSRMKKPSPVKITPNLMAAAAA